MLEKAEREARDRGCRQVLVTSFTFQAPDFYRQNSYTEFASSEGLRWRGRRDARTS